jgi:hypothetical protein
LLDDPGVLVRKAAIAAAVTSGAGAVRRRRPKKADPKAPAIPAQRSALSPLVEDDAELVLADQDAQDARILALIDRF